MTRDLPSLNGVRVFEAAARHQNFSRAAEELSVTQSAVSHQIHRLEEQLGDQLFVRNGPRLTLTPAGQEYLNVVQEGLAIIRRGTARVFRRETRPVLTLSVLPSFSQWFVPRLADFERRHPEISLRLSASYQVVDFALSTDIDAAIRFGKGHWPGVEAESILDDLLVPICNPLVAERLERPDDLLKERLLVEDPHWDFWSLWAEAAGLDQLPERVDRLSDDFNVQIQTAILGYGITLARGMLVADHIRQGRLVCPFPITVKSPVQYYFVCPRARLQEKAVRATKAWMQETAAATVAGMEVYWGSSPHPQRDS